MHQLNNQIWYYTLGFCLRLKNVCIICCIVKENRCQSCKYIFKSVQILTVPCIYTFELINYVLKNSEICYNLKWNGNYNTRGSYVFNYPIHRLSLFEKSPLYMALKIFNNIPNEIQNLDSNLMLSKFKKFVLQKAYNKVSEYLEEGPGIHQV